MPNNEIQHGVNNALITLPLSFHIDWKKPEWEVINTIPLNDSPFSNARYFCLSNLIKEKEMIHWMLSAYEAILHFQDIRPGSFVLKNLKKDVDKSLAIQSLFQHMIYLLHMQLYINQFEKRNERSLQIQIRKKIEAYYVALNLLRENSETIKKSNAATTENIPAFPLSITPIEWMKAQVASFHIAKTTVIQHALSQFHQLRFQLSLDKRLINILLNQFPDTFHYVASAKKLLQSIDPIFTAYTWQLLYARLGISLFLFFEHVIRGPWMREEESNIPLLERFKIQWANRKYSILNDALWGTSNLLSIVWFSPGGQAVKLLNGTIMLVSLLISLWQWREASDKQKTFIQRIEQRIIALSLLMNIDTIKHREIGITALDSYRWEQQMLSKILKQARLQWKAETYRYIGKLALSAAVVFGFVLVCAFAAPLSGSSAPVFTLGLLGSFILHGVMMMGSIIQLAIDRCLLRESLHEMKAHFGQPLTRKPDVSQIFKDLVQGKYQEDMIQYKTIQIIHMLGTKMLVPAMIVAAFVFMPSGFAIATTLATLILSHWLGQFIKKHVEPAIETIRSEAEKEFTEEKVNLLVNQSKKIAASTSGETMYRFFSESIFKKSGITQLTSLANPRV